MKSGSGKMGVWLDSWLYVHCGVVCKVDGTAEGGTPSTSSSHISNTISMHWPSCGTSFAANGSLSQDLNLNLTQLLERFSLV